MLTSSAYHMPLVMHIMHSGKDLSEFFFQFLTIVYITVSSFNLWLVDQVYVKQKSSAIVFVREFAIFYSRMLQLMKSAIDFVRDHARLLIYVHSF